MKKIKFLVSNLQEILLLEFSSNCLVFMANNLIVLTWLECNITLSFAIF